MKFTKSFTRQSALPTKSLFAATRVLMSGDLHRYQSQKDEINEVAAFEKEFAQWQDARFCLAVTSGGQAMQIAMRAMGVNNGTPVLTNAFTLAPVPGAIKAVGAEPVLVEVTRDLTIDLDDLELKARNSGSKYLLLSHMRGHLVDMDALGVLVESLSLTVIEDCAHTMGATWSGIKSGNFGHVACFSTQSYKHLNSGEGGLLTTNDSALMARAIILSGSYMNYESHEAAPSAQYFADASFDCPNMSARMDALRAAILRPQLEELDNAIENWNRQCSLIAYHLEKCELIDLPLSLSAACRVGSSLQFRVPDFNEDQCLRLVDRCAERGVVLKWFGRGVPAGFTSLHRHWRYLEPQVLPQTDWVLSTLFDIRIPLSFTDEDCRVIAIIISECVDAGQGEVRL